MDEQDDALTSANSPEPEDGVPAWLHELGTTLNEEDQPAETDSLDDESEVPDWLQDLRASLPEEPDDKIEHTEQEEGIPDWLAELRSSATQQEAKDTPPAPEPEVPDVTPETEGTPAWLAELRPAGGEAEVRVAPPGSEYELPDMVPEAEEMADWLTELRPTADEAEPESRPSISEPQMPDMASEGEEMPEWLAKLRQPADEAEPEAPGIEPEMPDMASEVEEIPAWLAEPEPLAEETEPGPGPSELEIEEADIPDWLTALQPAATEGEGDTGMPDLEQAEEETPDWLAEIQPSESEQEPEMEGPGLKEVAAAGATAAVIPDWLAAIQEEDAKAPQAVEETPVEVADLEAEPVVLEPAAGPEPPIAESEAPEHPDELPEAQPGEIEEEPEGEVLDATELAAAAAAAAAVPDWLAAIEIEVEEETPQATDEAGVDVEIPAWALPTEPGWEIEDALAPAEIPSWLLALKPTELREEGETDVPADAFEEPGDNTGLLANISGILPVEMLIAQPRAATETPVAETLITDTPKARMFADIVGRPPEAAPKEIAPEPSRVLAQVPRWIIYAVLIVAVAIPLVLGKPLLPHSIEATQPEQDLYAEIDALGNNAAVLVAFDYDPTTSGEMDVIAQALVGQVMDRGAKVVLMSLLPAGPATAQLLLDKATAERADYADSYGRLYANLGYLPGEATAVRLVGLSLESAFSHDYYGTPLSDLPVMQGLADARSFDLIIELAATQDSLRWWIEQASTAYDIPLGAGVSASVAPLARPYYETEQKQLVGMISGVPGAVSYETLRAGQAEPPDELAVRLDSLMAGYAILILVILAGNVAFLTRRGAGREH